MVELIIIGVLVVGVVAIAGYCYHLKSAINVLMHEMHSLRVAYVMHILGQKAQELEEKRETSH